MTPTKSLTSTVSILDVLRRTLALPRPAPTVVEMDAAAIATGAGAVAEAVRVAVAEEAVPEAVPAAVVATAGGNVTSSCWFLVSS